LEEIPIPFFIILALTVLVFPVRAEQKPKISCLGQIIAGERTLVLSAPEGSILGQLLVKRGDRVARGAELARLIYFLHVLAGQLICLGREKDKP
jgi:multidrug efflux pump subunit AcrA (membrane-fusion protein)